MQLTMSSWNLLNDRSIRICREEWEALGSWTRDWLERFEHRYALAYASTLPDFVSGAFVRCTEAESSGLL